MSEVSFDALQREYDNQCDCCDKHHHEDDDYDDGYDEFDEQDRQEDFLRSLGWVGDM